MPYKDSERKRANSASYRQRNREKIALKAKAEREEGRQLIILAKARPCADCGKTYPYYVMDFDHKPETEVSHHLKPRGRHGMDRLAGSKNLLLAEIAKCDVVCANCHRERTWGPK